MRVNINYDYSELVIRNLQTSDSGIYKLAASNINEKQEICIILLVKGKLYSKMICEQLNCRLQFVTHIQ